MDLMATMQGTRRKAAAALAFSFGVASVVATTFGFGNPSWPTHATEALWDVAGVLFLWLPFWALVGLALLSPMSNVAVVLAAAALEILYLLGFRDLRDPLSLFALWLYGCGGLVAIYAVDETARGGIGVWRRWRAARQAREM